MAYNPQSPLSLIDQAFAAWLISFVPTVPAIGIAPDLTQSPPVIGDIFGAVSIQQKPLPCTIIYCEGGPEVSPYTGNYRVKVTIMVKSALAKDITDQDDDSSNAHESRSAATYAALQTQDTPGANGMPNLCAALNATALGATFFQITPHSGTAMERDFLEDAVIDSYIYEAIVCPSIIS